MLSEHRSSMDAATMAVVLLCSGFIGFLFAPLGLGGGLLFAPLLHYGLGWEKKAMFPMYGSSKVSLEHCQEQSSGLSL